MSDEILVDLLARTDAVFWPDRHPGNLKRNRVITERRRLYHQSGVLLVEDAHIDDAARKARQRTFAHLKAAGYLETFRARYARTSAARLTDAGDRRARHMADQVPFEKSLTLLDRLYFERGNPLCTDGGAAGGGLTWHNEYVLGQVDPADLEAWNVLHGLEFGALPLLARGLVESRADSGGAIWYALTGEGMALGKRRAAPAPPAAVEPSQGVTPAPAAEKLFEMLYEAALRREFATIEVSKPLNDREIGEFHLAPPLVMTKENLAAWAAWKQDIVSKIN